MPKTSVLSLVVLALCLPTQMCAEENVKTAPKPLKVGDVAPDFEMKGSDGKTYKLADFKDKSAVLVAWYPKALTGG